jgi:hypothetical protein
MKMLANIDNFSQDRRQKRTNLVKHWPKNQGQIFGCLSRDFKETESHMREKRQSKRKVKGFIEKKACRYNYPSILKAQNQENWICGFA